ncbi:hypothetical protein HYX11_05555 [Candidatus Woesearchaeota archaeon]|nr:hypothetical protein [Candidatus Woesearchaeota archaeon]
MFVFRRYIFHNSERFFKVDIKMRRDGSEYILFCKGKMYEEIIIIKVKENRSPPVNRLWHARLRARVGFLTMLFPLYVLVDVYHQ